MTTEVGLVAVYNARGIDFLTDNTKTPPITYYRSRHTGSGDLPEGPIRDLFSGVDPEVVRARYGGLNLHVSRPHVQLRRVSDSLPDRNPRATPDGLGDKDDFPPEEPQYPGSNRPRSFR